MANVFVSYERSDEATARQAIEALGPGHEVWYDALIPPHRDYTDVITEQLKAAEVVLVLWSQTAANSDWVRAEADYAREEGKLVQAALDASVPPMPFNRIQCAKLDRWHGESSNAEWQKVLQSIEHVAAARVGPAATSAASTAARPATRATRSRSLVWTIAASGVIAAALVAFGLARFRSHVPPASVARFAILPFDVLSADPDTRFFADALADQITTTLSRNHIQVVSRDDATALRGPDRDGEVARLGIAMLLDGTVRRDGGEVTVRTHLDDPVRHAIVWSSEFEEPVDRLTRLQARVATSTLGVLSCSNRALRPTNGLTDPALLTRYLRACDLFANYRASDPKQVLELLSELRAVTVGAPDFAPGFSDFAMFQAHFAELWPERAAVLRAEAADAARRALAIDPKTPNAYAALALVLPTKQWAERERLLRAGIAVDPSWPHVHGYLTEEVLEKTGRWKEAIDEIRAAGAADLQIDWSRFATLVEARAGGPAGPCIEAFTWELDVLPFSAGPWSALLGCRVLAAQWDEGLAMLTAPSAPTAGTPLGDALIATLIARKTGAAGDREKARALNLAAAEAAPASLQVTITDLAGLGFVDDAFVVAARLDANVNDTTNLFERPTASMRRDPRFMALAARIGLVDYWRTSGRWPDFCSEPGLPYDCKAEAERVQPQLAGSKSA